MEELIVLNATVPVGVEAAMTARVLSLFFLIPYCHTPGIFRLHQVARDTMNEASMIYPMFAMVIVTVVVLTKLFRSRVQAVKDEKISATYFRTYQGEEEPESTIKLSRHFKNIFEAPVLFYVVCLAAMITHQVTVLLQILAWVYVVARTIHAYVHVGGNRIGKRIRIYMISWVVLLLMWVYLVFSVATA